MILYTPRFDLFLHFPRNFPVIKDNKSRYWYDDFWMMILKFARFNDLDTTKKCAEDVIYRSYNCTLFINAFFYDGIVFKSKYIHQNKIWSLKTQQRIPFKLYIHLKDQVSALITNSEPPNIMCTLQSSTIHWYTKQIIMLCILSLFSEKLKSW